ncbi:uncharacterized protein LOC119548073 [Drosophila subpulchrella]|uniref:uncharacterized protein LOC119548073 n=1 Tax=Drosophila subpulchrella TaxID=1486046 RepID=UPI0018A1A028|nr:uncharacterized protein LOC119548073 [Drosophila subpulchrella]
MYQNNKYRKHLEDHFYGTKNTSPLNENKEHGQCAYKDVECQARRERINSPENIPQICKQTYTSEKYLARQDNYGDYNKRPCENPTCSYEQHQQRVHQAHDPFYRKYYHSNHSNHHYKYDDNRLQSQQHQLSNQSNARQQWSPKRVNEHSPVYSPKPYNSHFPFGRSTRNQEPVNENGGGDCLLYKNLTYGAPPSSKSDDGGGDRGAMKHSPQCKSPHQKRESHNRFEAAKAHCQAIGDQFRRQFAPSSEGSSSKGSKSKPSKVTVISAKSGDDLRAAVRSQIELQEAIEEFKLEVRNKQGEALSDDKSSPHPKKIQSPKSDSVVEDVVAMAMEPHSDNALSDDLQDEDLTGSPDKLVNTKVIEPMIMKIQRMYLNTLQEEFQLIEYLGTIPKLVKDVYNQETDEEEKMHKET